MKAVAIYPNNLDKSALQKAIEAMKRGRIEPDADGNYILSPYGISGAIPSMPSALGVKRPEPDPIFAYPPSMQQGVDALLNRAVDEILSTNDYHQVFDCPQCGLSFANQIRLLESPDNQTGYIRATCKQCQVAVQEKITREEILNHPWKIDLLKDRILKLKELFAPRIERTESFERIPWQSSPRKKVARPN